jgi:hypothetical protein
VESAKLEYAVIGEINLFFCDFPEESIMLQPVATSFRPSIDIMKLWHRCGPDLKRITIETILRRLVLTLGSIGVEIRSIRKKRRNKRCCRGRH